MPYHPCGWLLDNATSLTQENPLGYVMRLPRYGDEDYDDGEGNQAEAKLGKRRDLRAILNLELKRVRYGEEEAFDFEEYEAGLEHVSPGRGHCVSLNLEIDRPSV